MPFSPSNSTHCSDKLGHLTTPSLGNVRVYWTELPNEHSSFPFGPVEVSRKSHSPFVGPRPLEMFQEGAGETIASFKTVFISLYMVWHMPFS